MSTCRPTVAFNAARRAGAGVVIAAMTAGAAELKYMSVFTGEEYAKAHVRPASWTVPQDFVDGQWQGIIAASDGRTYFSVSCHGPDNNAQFYRFDPKTSQVQHLADVGVWCGYTDSPGKRNAQGKIHSNIYEYRGKLYCTTTSAHATLEHPYPGGHFLSYDLATGKAENLGKLDYDGKGGLLSAVFDPVYERLYAIHQHRTMLAYYDLKTGQIVEVGPVEDGGKQCRSLIMGQDGVVFGSTRDGMIFRYDPATDTRSCLLTRVPYDPAAKQPEPNPKSDGWQGTHWSPMVWDAVGGWWYGVRGNDEYLFKFRPPTDPKSHIGEAEGLAPFGFQPSAVSQPRHASLGMALKGRTLYYCSYPIWRPMAHLMSYNLETAKVTDHGPIVVEDGRRVSEIHSLVVGSDGNLHAVAMVWSLPEKDPAKPWANRGSCFFHARFVVIDPTRDFRPANPATDAPVVQPRAAEPQAEADR